MQNNLLTQTKIVICTLACNCDPNGSTSLICNKETGQCACKPNVVERQCKVCENGFKGHPECVCKYNYHLCSFIVHFKNLF